MAKQSTRSATVAARVKDAAAKAVATPAIMGKGPVATTAVTTVPQSPQPAAQPTGAYHVWTADRDGKLLNYSPTGSPDPGDVNAVEIYFGLPAGASPPQEQVDLLDGIAQALEATKTLYIKQGRGEGSFRIFYTRLFRLAQLGLEGVAMPTLAKLELNRVVADLIVAEGGRIKNAHLALLGKWSAGSIALALGLYVLIRVMPPDPVLSSLSIDQGTASSFMMLWAGSFGGVWLSYAVRKTVFTLRDLVVTDDDRLLPLTRLIFAGALTMFVGLLLTSGFVDVSIGGAKLSSFAQNPTLALLLGLVCGLSELLLPTMVAKRASEFVAKLG